METYPEITQLIELLDKMLKEQLIQTPYVQECREHEYDKRGGRQKKVPNQISRDEVYNVEIKN